MKAPARVTLLGSHCERLKRIFEASPDEHEQAAAVLFRRINRKVEGMVQSDRYISVDVVPFEPEWIISSSPSHVSFQMAQLREAFRRCDEEDLTFAFAHNHPAGSAEFSEIDEENERCLIEALSNRNGISTMGAILYVDGKWSARFRHTSDIEKPMPARHVSVVTDHLSVHVPSNRDSKNNDAFVRQEAAFGEPFVGKLSSLRVGIVGSGGTGSAVATLLARAGVSELIVVDYDKLEETNLNRVKGTRKKDLGRFKVEIIEEFIGDFGLPINVAGIKSVVDNSPIAVDAISTCDVVFGCTDDQLGRRLLNLAAYFYELALIDIGLGGLITKDIDGHALLYSHYGRVSTVLPESGECLFCQGVLNEDHIRYEEAARENPGMTSYEAAERYLDGGGEQAPGVGPFTGATADFAVATLFDLIRPYRKFSETLRRDYYEIDFVKMAIRSRQPANNSECVFCGKRQFVAKREDYRLCLPALGRLADDD